MNKTIKKILPWVLVFTFLLLFCFLFINIKNNNISGFDNNIYNIVIQNKNDYLTKFYEIVTNFGEAKLIIIVLILLVIFIKNKKVGINFSLASIGAFGINFIIKHIVKRARPVGIALVTETGYSFPSSHAMIAITFYGLIIYFIWQTKLKKSFKILLTILLSIIISLICISRIYLGVHFASDVLAGFLLGFSFLITFIEIIIKKMGSK